MAVRFTNEHTSWAASSPITWKIEIHDSAHVGDSTDFEVADGSRLGYRADGDTLVAPILASTFSFDMIIQDATHADLITDLAGAKEGRFTIVLYKDAVFHWAGVINAQDLDFEDADYPYQFTITAVDGLALLKNYEYRQDGTDTNKWDLRYTGISRIIEIIDRCIKKIPHIPTHFTGATKFLVTAINWYSEDDETPGSDDYDPFYYKYLDNRAFGFGQNTGNGKFMSCYEVLSQILTTFNARIALYDGYFLIEQLEHRAFTIGSNANYSRYYAYDGTGPTANSNLDNSQNVGLSESIKKLRGGSYSFVPPLRSCRVTQTVNGLQNLIAGAYFDSDTVETYDAGAVIGDGVNTFVRFTGNISWTLTNPVIILNHYVLIGFRLKIVLDSLYAQQDVSISENGTATASPQEWSASTEYIDIYAKQEIIAGETESTGVSSFDIMFRTDSTFTGGNLSVSFEFNHLLDIKPNAANSGSAPVIDPADYDIDWSLNDPYCVILNNPKKIKISGLTPATAYPKSVTYEVIGDEDNTEVQQLDVIVGGLASNVVNQWGGLLHLSGADYVYAADWGARTGTRDRPIIQLLAQRIMAARYFPRKILRGTAVGSPIVIQTPITESGETYILKNGVYNTVRDELNGEWVRLAFTEAEFTYAPIEYNTGEYQGTTPGGSSGVGGSSGGVNNGGGGVFPPAGVGGNGIYGGSGTVSAGTVATMSGDFTFSNVSASAGEAFIVSVDDGSNSGTIKNEAGSGLLLQATGTNTIQIEGITQFSDVVSPTTLNADQNDYAGLNGANVGRLDCSTSVTITGLAQGVAGRILFVTNINSTFFITFSGENASSIAANRFAGPDLIVRPGQTAGFIYDANTSRWRSFGVYIPLAFTNNRVLTGGGASGSAAIVDEANLTFDGTNLGIGGTDDYRIDVRSASTESQLHFSGTGADSGGYLVSAGASNFFMAGGASYNGTNWVAKATSATVIGGGATAGDITLYCNTGLTAGNTFSVTERARLTSGGLFGVGTSSPNSVINAALNSGTTNAAVTILTLDVNTTGTAAANFGPRILFRGESTTTTNSEMAAIWAAWSTATHASRSADILFATVNNAGSLTEKAKIVSTGDIGIKKNDAGTTQDTASITAYGSESNLGIAVVPKGTGALTGHIADGAATGGNARGQYAVDWQLIRTNASDVASGNYSTIPGGRRCTASGAYSFATGFRATASGDGSVAFGGSGAFSTGASATGTNSFAFGTGADATATNAIAFNADSSAQNAVAFNESADKIGQVRINGLNHLTLSRLTLGTSTQELFLDATAARATIGSGFTWVAEVRVHAKVSVVGNGTVVANDIYAATYKVVIANKGGTTALVGTVQADMAAQSDASMSGASFTISADNTNDALKIEYVPGPNEGSTTQINVDASIWYDEF